LNFAAGSLVRARGREWIVLPESSTDLLVLRPLTGTDDEISGILPQLEDVSPATFGMPRPSDLGDHSSARLLHEAVRLGVRASAGPFRSFGRLAFEPRPYQLVPLLMALRLDPIRLLIADDVGIGKTIEASLIARELYDRHTIRRLAVLCPPHLVEQWRNELRDKFHFDDAQLVLPGTAARLERGLHVGESVFDRYPITVVSTDFIKADRRRDEFLRAAPEFVIVDEAHSCADANAASGSRHQRYRLVRGLADNKARHLVLVTATPHSGNDGAFGELVGFLDRSFTKFADELSVDARAEARRRLARHLIRRRRGDIRRYLDADTSFPERLPTQEETYNLGAEYRQLFESALRYAREVVRDPGAAGPRRRIRWWAVLGLLRALGSSPAAAAETLRSRASTAGTADEIDDAGRRSVLDLDEAVEGADVSPGADAEDDAGESADDRPRAQRRLLEMARQADRLKGPGRDTKLKRAVEIVKDLLDDGFNPIVFCRFIATADYVKSALRDALDSKIAIDAVTGLLTPEEREQRIAALRAQSERRVLVATDCLSEGINLQDGFDAVVHYDLSWNPTRHEQREGRVDRFGQKSPTVKVVTYYGRDNRIDGLVLNVLLRKHASIRNALGVSVPVPVDSNDVIEAILEGLLLRGHPGEDLNQLTLFEDIVAPQRERLHARMDALEQREKRSRTVFAQETIRVEDVAEELSAARDAVGSGVDVARFTAEVLRRAGASVQLTDIRLHADLGGVPQALRDIAGLAGADLRAAFEPPGAKGESVLGRSHPIVEGLAAYVLDGALEGGPLTLARRGGVIRTRGVSVRTHALVIRLRYELVERAASTAQELVEECRIVAYAGAAENPEWLEDEKATALLGLLPDGNVAPEQAVEVLTGSIGACVALNPALERYATARASLVSEAHERVRGPLRRAGRVDVTPQLPVDILGVYVYLPAV
jgi:superfamily II DNA or RNA helicase